MKTNKINILLLFIIAIFTFSCGSDELETIETKSIDFELQEKGFEKPYNSSEIIRIRFENSTTEEEKQAIRNLYFFSCFETQRPFLNICGNNFYIEMYNPNEVSHDVEYWILATCNGRDLIHGCPETAKEAINNNTEVDDVE